MEEGNYVTTVLRPRGWRWRVVVDGGGRWWRRWWWCRCWWRCRRQWCGSDRPRASPRHAGSRPGAAAERTAPRGAASVRAVNSATPRRALHPTALARVALGLGPLIPASRPRRRRQAPAGPLAPYLDNRRRFGSWALAPRLPLAWGAGPVARAGVGKHRAGSSAGTGTGRRGQLACGVGGGT